MVVVSGWVGNFSFINKYALVGASLTPIHVLDIFPQKDIFYCNTWVIIAMQSLKGPVHSRIHFDSFPTKKKICLNTIKTGY